MATLTLSLPAEPHDRVIELEGDEVSIGRDESNTVVLSDNATSRRHAVLRRSEDGWVLLDTGSRNGTWVGGQRVTERNLVDGDEIRIGKSVMTFSDPPDPQATVLMDVSAYQEQAVAAPAPERPPALQEPQVAPPAPSPPPQGPPETAAPPPVQPQAPPPPPPPPRPAAPAPPPAFPPVAAPVAAAPAADPASSVHLAGFGIRLAAYLVDGLILGLLFGAVSLVTALIAGAVARSSPEVAVGLSILAYLAVTLISVAYLVFFWARSGATPGKRVFGLRVIRADGVRPLGLGRALVRVLGYMACSMTLCIGFLMVAFSERRQGLHDLIAGTLVVRGSGRR